MWDGSCDGEGWEKGKDPSESHWEDWDFAMAVCVDAGGPETCQTARAKSDVLETCADLHSCGMLKCWAIRLGPGRRGGQFLCDNGSRRVKFPFNSSALLQNSYIIAYKKRIIETVAGVGFLERLESLHSLRWSNAEQAHS